MGRCYEFGVSIADGCEHAMAVADEGGYCHCTACGSRCDGRFRACAEVVAKPGYVPVAAPKVAPAAGRAISTARLVGASEVVEQRKPRFSLFGAAVNPEEPHEKVLAEYRSVLDTLLDRHQQALAAIEAMDNTVGARDAELVAMFNRLTRAYKELTEEVRTGHDELVELANAVVRLAARIDDQSRPGQRLHLQPVTEEGGAPR